MSITISIPQHSLVVLIGLPACGKTTFARRHFQDSSVISSDACRRLVSDDEGNQVASPQAFALMETIIDKRMELHRLSVADAMNLQIATRRPWLDLARRHDYPAYAIAFDVPPAVCIERDTHRPRRVGAAVIVNNVRRMLFDTADLLAEGFSGAWRLGMAVIDETKVEVRPPPRRTRRSSH